jgi:uncharacterized coiled-coil protein SlyX
MTIYTTTSIRLEADVFRDLQVAAHVNNTTVNAVVSQVLSKYVNHLTDKGVISPEMRDTVPPAKRGRRASWQTRRIRELESETAAVRRKSIKLRTAQLTLMRNHAPQDQIDAATLALRDALAEHKALVEKNSVLIAELQASLLASDPDTKPQP